MTPETTAKKEIRDWLTWNGWFVFPILQGLGAYKGIPDLEAIKGGIVLFIEVKAPKGKLSESQEKFKYDCINHKGHYIMAKSYLDVEYYLNTVLPQEEA